MSDSNPNEDPRIIVDEDWKERAQREKEAAEAAKRARQSQGSTESPSAGHRDDAGTGPPLPPASFGALVSSLAAQAMAALGQVPDPAEGRPVVRSDLARHLIDTLGVLEEKTQGNLTPDESKMLDSVLHELRLVYLAVSKAPADPAKGPAGAK